MSGGRPQEERVQKLDVIAVAAHPDDAEAVALLLLASEKTELDAGERLFDAVRLTPPTPATA